MPLIKHCNWFADLIYTEIFILTGSHSCLDAFKLAFPRSYILKNSFKILLEFLTKSITISRLKSHTDILGNERADKLAKNAIELNHFAEKIILKFPLRR